MSESDIYLKPCPFCGGEGEIVTVEQWIPEHYPRCKNEHCPARNMWKGLAECYGVAVFWETPEAAAEAWNKRPGEEALEVQIENLRATVEAYKGAIASIGADNNAQKVLAQMISANVLFVALTDITKIAHQAALKLKELETK